MNPCIGKGTGRVAIRSKAPAQHSQKGDDLRGIGLWDNGFGVMGKLRTN